MKNFFQRKQDNQPKPTRSNTPDAYKVWLPPPDAASRTAAAGPSTWIPTSGQSTARKGDETHRSSSRAPRADVPTYNYGTVPNVTGFYSNNPSQSVPVQPFPAHYYPSPVPRPPGGLERPDSRLGYVPYPYQPQSFAAAPVPSQPPTLRKREAKTRNAVDGHVAPPAPAAGRPSSSRRQSEKDEVRAPRQPSPSIREYKREDVEVKKSKHRTREPSETRKRRDSQAGDLYEKYRDKSSRKESRRDGKSRTDPRVEEGDSSDSSIQRPSSSTGHRRRRTTEEGKPVLMMNKDSVPLSAGPRTAFPMQPTAGSSSSGKHTPQLPRMPVYLPAKSQRHDEGQPGLSESDTDHGTLSRGRNFLRGTAVPSSKQQPTSTVAPREPPQTIKKAKESRGLWPFSRSRSAQKLPQSMPIAAPSVPKPSAQKVRADSTPSPFPQVPMDSAPDRPQYRRHASDNTIGASSQIERAPAPQPSHSRPALPDQILPSSRTFFFAQQSNESSSRPVASASQQAAPNGLRTGPSVPRGQNAGAQVIEPPPATTMTSSHQFHGPPSSTLQAQAPTGTWGLNLVPRSETPLRRDGRDRSNLPPIYAPAVASRASDFPRAPDRSAPDRSTTPKVSQLVAGFEARSSDTQPGIPQQMARPPHKRDVVEKPSLAQIYAPSQQPNQGAGEVSMSSQRPQTTTAGSHAPQRPVQLKSHSASDVNLRPVESTKAQARPEVLKSQLRDLLSDKPSASRNDERAASRVANVSEPRPDPPHPPPAPYSNLKPADWNPSSQLHAFSQAPVQVYTAGTSSVPFRPPMRSEKPVEIPSISNAVPSGSSRRHDVPQSDSAHRASRLVSSKPGDEAERGHGRHSRTSKKDLIAVMKTPSKDSSRHTSSPSPQSTSRPNDKSAQPHPSSGSSYLPSTSRSAEVQTAGRHDPPSVPSNSAPIPSHVSGGASQRDHRTTRTLSHDPQPATSNAPHVSSVGSNERSRTTPSAFPPPVPSNQSLPTPSSISPARPPSRSAVPNPSSIPPVDAPPALIAQQSARPSVTSGSSSNSHTVLRVPSEESILKTPSSLAFSALQPSVSRTSIPASTNSETRKKGIFGMFRSKGSQSTETPTVLHPPPTKTPAPQSSSESIVNSKPSSDRKSGSRSKVPPPITVPNPALPISDRKSPNRVFTPFRYLTSKRNRRISTASVDAVDGTAANTVMGSPTASMQSSQMPTQSPPQRDPRAATQDWRNQEESDIMARGKRRRMRPGVVFDVAEDPLEETRRTRPARAKKAQPAAAEAPTDSSDG